MSRRRRRVVCARGYTAGLRRADEQVNAMSGEVKRYAAGDEQPVLWSVHNATHLRADNAEVRVAELERELAWLDPAWDSLVSRASW